MTFEVGDKVVHPAYGAGEITAIEEKDFLNHSNQYYVICMPAKDLTVLVPTEKADEFGLRPVGKQSVLEKMLRILQGIPKDLPEEYKERQAGIKEKLQTGGLLEIARAIRDLTGREQERTLTEADRDLLHRAQDFVASELALACGLRIEEAHSRIQAALHDVST